MEAEQKRLQAELAAAQAATAKAEAEAARAAAQAEQQKAVQAAQEAERLRWQAEQEKLALRRRLLEQFSLVLDARDTERGLVVNIGDVLFASGSSTLRPEAREKLARFSGIVLAYPDLRLQTEGHTDNVGSLEMNQKLSEDRAERGPRISHFAGRACRERHLARDEFRGPGGRQRYGRRAQQESPRGNHYFGRDYRQRSLFGFRQPAAVKAVGRACDAMIAEAGTDLLALVFGSFSIFWADGFVCPTLGTRSVKHAARPPGLSARWWRCLFLGLTGLSFCTRSWLGPR